jgi:hypothetical protein
VNITSASRAYEAERLSPELVAHILDYVDPEHRVILQAHVLDSLIVANVRFVSPEYTRRKVAYLNSSVLAVALAQVGQLFLDVSVRRGSTKLATYLSAEYLDRIRSEHQICFVDLRMVFHQKHPAVDYALSLCLLSSHRLRDTAFFKVGFEVGAACEGSFVASVPLSA